MQSERAGKATLTPKLDQYYYLAYFCFRKHHRSMLLMLDHQEAQEHLITSISKSILYSKLPHFTTILTST